MPGLPCVVVETVPSVPPVAVATASWVTSPSPVWRARAERRERVERDVVARVGDGADRHRRVREPAGEPGRALDVLAHGAGRAAGAVRHGERKRVGPRQRAAERQRVARVCDRADGRDRADGQEALGALGRLCHRAGRAAGCGRDGDRSDVGALQPAASEGQRVAGVGDRSDRDRRGRAVRRPAGHAEARPSRSRGWSYVHGVGRSRSRRRRSRPAARPCARSPPRT